MHVFRDQNMSARALTAEIDQALDEINEAFTRCELDSVMPTKEALKVMIRGEQPQKEPVKLKKTFDELFEGIRAVAWERWIPRNGRFWVRKASSIRSRLFSPSDIQSIVKKAMVEELKGRYRISWFPEDGPSYPFRVQIRNDEVSVCLDTSGESLHKRGYRISPVIAPSVISVTEPSSV